MRNSKIAPIIVAIILAIGAGLWIWCITSIDYSPMKARSAAAPAATAAQQN